MWGHLFKYTDNVKHFLSINSKAAKVKSVILGQTPVNLICFPDLNSNPKVTEKNLNAKLFNHCDFEHISACKANIQTLSM